MRYQQLITLALAVIFIASCAITPRETRDNSGIEMIQKELAAIEDNPQSEDIAPPPQVDEALLPPLMGGGSLAASEDLFDVSVDEANARDFFMGLVKGTPYNMVVHPDVQGTISLELQISLH